MSSSPLRIYYLEPREKLKKCTTATNPVAQNYFPCTIALPLNDNPYIHVVLPTQTAYLAPLDEAGEAHNITLIRNHFFSKRYT